MEIILHELLLEQNNTNQAFPKGLMIIWRYALLIGFVSKV